MMYLRVFFEYSSSYSSFLIISCFFVERVTQFLFGLNKSNNVKISFQYMTDKTIPLNIEINNTRFKVI